MSLSKDFTDRLADKIALYDELYEDAFKNMPTPGVRDTRGDAQFLAWWYSMIAAYGPDWVAALDFVDGGRETLKRANRLLAVVMQGGMTNGLEQ